MELIKLEFWNSVEMVENSLEVYEKLLLDVLNGDGMNFFYWEEVV